MTYSKSSKFTWFTPLLWNCSTICSLSFFQIHTRVTDPVSSVQHNFLFHHFVSSISTFSDMKLHYKIHLNIKWSNICMPEFKHLTCFLCYVWVYMICKSLHFVFLYTLLSIPVFGENWGCNSDQFWWLLGYLWGFLLLLFFVFKEIKYFSKLLCDAYLPCLC